MDRIVLELGRLRMDAGGPSFGEIAARITSLRESRGLSDAASRVARSTVYDAFRPGRNRLNPELVADVVLVLGGTEADAERMRRHSVRARQSVAAAAATMGAPSPDTDTVGTTPEPALTPPAARPASTRPDTRPVGARTAAARPAGPDASAMRPALPRASAILLILAVCIATNLAGSEFILLVPLPVYLDMIGTAIAAIALGPWYGVAVALASHGLSALIHTLADGQLFLEGLPFAVVNVVGALVWGYGVRSWGLGRTPLRFLLLSAMVAVACTLTAVPIIIWGFQGENISSAAAMLADRVLSAGAGVWVAMFSANIITSLLDKLIAGFVALSVAPMLLAWAGRSAPTGVLPTRRETNLALVLPRRHVLSPRQVPRSIR